MICWNALVSGYDKNGKVDLTIRCLNEMQKNGMKPKVTSWNGVISVCVQNGYFENGLNVFNEMLRSYDQPNVVTIVSILPACAGLGDLKIGQAVHAYAIKNEFCGNIHVEGSLINMYSKCGRIDLAECVCEDKGEKDCCVERDDRCLC